jgi:hypothetical protein
MRWEWACFDARHHHDRLGLGNFLGNFLGRTLYRAEIPHAESHHHHD